ncbi:hypothetical protein CSC17_0933 [Klebsiella oxytoca]|nr:hypothetical protein CSC17_0933 [Klebsiella oxytoca]
MASIEAKKVANPHQTSILTKTPAMKDNLSRGQKKFQD